MIVADALGIDIHALPGDAGGIGEYLAQKIRLRRRASSHTPYCWAVSGLWTVFFGEHAECDARAEARRIGGTAEAFPLYRDAVQDREDAERVRNAAAILDTLTNNLWEGHPLRAEAASGSKQAVADLFADQLDSRSAAKGEA
ncbi:hypothetical protein [Corticimicrobacter populi]|nr:hypothetical protein [Corticimicrobacter populi]